MASMDLKSPALQKLLLAILIAGGALGVFYFTHLVPFGFMNSNEKLSALKSDYERKSSELARARASVADLPRFEAEYEQLHQRWELASELLPTDRQLSTLLRKITLAGQQTGVSFVLFRPGGTRPQEYHTELPVQISVQGNYHDVGAFLAELANLRRIVTVSNLKLTSVTKQGAGTTLADFTASAYSLNTASTQPAPVAKDGKKGETNGRKS
ncbi:MAG: type 4a pilus biogenesis protein PilO [Candidatus Eisenbacteria bacterium]|nr:type 4a pilus biogenesis protein PilO [Candidatus Eisenbacteria bacterium]